MGEFQKGNLSICQQIEGCLHMFNPKHEYFSCRIRILEIDFDALLRLKRGLKNGMYSYAF